SPLSDYKDVDKVGWHATVNATFAIPLSPVGIRVDGLYGQTSHKDIGTTPVDGKTKLIGGLANVVYKIPVPAPMVKPYLLGGVGGPPGRAAAVFRAPASRQESGCPRDDAAGEQDHRRGVQHVHGPVAVMRAEHDNTPQQQQPDRTDKREIHVNTPTIFRDGSA